MKKVAFLCVHNSCRSQIAEALCKKLPETFAADTEEDLPEEDALEGRWSALLYALFRNPEDRDKWQELEEAPP